MKLFNFKKKNPKRGISLAETVVALAIIMIVSATAVTLILASVNQESNMNRSLEISRHAENAIECFRYSDSREEFLIALKKTDAEFTEKDGAYVLSKPMYTLVITADFDVLELKISASDPDEKNICELDYKKAQRGDAG